MPIDSTPSPRAELHLDMVIENGPSKIEVRSLNGEIFLNHTKLSGLHYLLTQLPDSDILEPLVELVRFSPFEKQLCHIQILGKTVFTFRLGEPPSSLRDIIVQYLNTLL